MIRDLIAKGIGFTPGSVKFIPTHGFLPSGVAPAAVNGMGFWLMVWLRRRVEDDE